MGGTITVGITIFLGAIGSGVWELWLRDVYISSRVIVLNIVSLGMASIKDRTYQSIARGFHETYSLALITLLNLFFIIMMAAFGIYSIWRLIIWRRYLKRHSSRTARTQPAKKFSLTEKKRQLGLSLIERQRRRARRFVVMYVTQITLIYVLIVPGYTSLMVRENYKNAAIAHYLQMFDISAPYLSESERLTIKSEFAQMRTGADYYRILQKLELVAQDHGLNRPTFRPW